MTREVILLADVRQEDEHRILLVRALPLGVTIMPDPALIQEHSLAVVPTFFAHISQSFAFLPETYGCRLHAQHLEAIDDLRDTNATVVYLGDKVEVDIRWAFAEASLNVLLVELAIPRVSPSKRYMWGTDQDAARMVQVYTLAEMLGHADDPDFALGDTSSFDGRTISKRFKRIQANLPSVLNGLARATERYASGILHGDTTIFPDVVRFCTQQMHARGFC
jgi:hypothetical protein